MEEQGVVGSTSVVERSASHFLTVDEEGWALWSTDQDDDDPLLTFPPDEAGEERARSAFEIRTRETRRVRWLAIVAVAAGFTWLALRVLSQLIEWLGPKLFAPLPQPDSFLSPIDVETTTYKVVRVIGSVSDLMFALFEVAIGLFIVAWLQRRWRREG